MSRSVEGSETLLLVEDEFVVRTLVGRVLRSFGYNVLEAGNASEALALCAEYEGRIDLLVTDVIMPGGMSGRDLVERLAELRPETKVIYTSGYSDDAIVRRGILRPGVHFVKKPFTPAALARKVREVLGGPPRGKGEDRADPTAPAASGL
jgi:two-component system cell cycle sensor histidine kinase/response regulator CckA